MGSATAVSALLQWPTPAERGLSLDMPNIQQQIKRVRISERQRDENLRYRSTVKTVTKRLETAAADGDKDKVAAEHLELVRLIDKAASKGALHKNTAARKKARAARVVASS